MKAPFAIFGATILAVAACGARSELRVEQVRHHADAGEDALDAGPDVEDAPDVFDAPPDVVDAPPDVPIPDDCVDAGTTYVYLITAENFLFKFYPPDASFVQIGQIECVPPGAGNTPFSMAVDRQGIAYVVFQQGELFRVSTANASCKSTSFVSGQQGFSTRFGMGFSANASDPGETLYVAGSDGSEQLATIDPLTFELKPVGFFDTPIGDAELTGTGDAKLYGFGVENTGTTTFLHLAQIQKDTAQILDDQFIDLGTGGAGLSAWAFAFWGGDFYFFTSTSPGSSKVSRYHPGDASAADYAFLGETIVGAGVSTCAPQQ